MAAESALFCTRRLKGCAVSLATLVILLGGLVAVTSLWAAVRRSAWIESPEGAILIVRDPRLGWRATPERDLPLPGAGGSFTTDANGRRRDDSGHGRPFLLVLGDSFTHAAGVPDGSVYYDEISRRLEIGIVALGVNGYGTAQEFLAASDLRSSIVDPAALLLQMCGNDPVNNSWALEKRSWVNNNMLPRPYLDRRAEIAIRDPRRFHERFALGREVTRRLLAPRLSTIETRVSDGEEEALVLYRRELASTRTALEELRALFPEVPAFAFDVGGGGGRVGADLARLGREAGLTYLELEPVFSDRSRGREVFLADGEHWNAEGHRLVGEILAEQLKLR